MNSNYQNISLMFYFSVASVLQFFFHKLTNQVSTNNIHNFFFHLLQSLRSFHVYAMSADLGFFIAQRFLRIIQQQYSSSSLSTLSLNWDVGDQPQLAFHAWIEVFEWKCQVPKKFSHFLIKFSRPIMNENNLNIEICQK